MVVQLHKARDRADAACGALLGTFVGDALGMPFEGRAPAQIPEQLEMLDARLGRGTYTDDTQMMIALAESLIERQQIDEQHLAEAFLEAFEPTRGYGGGTVQVFELWRKGTPVAAAAAMVFDGQGSFGNGAAMRIAPVGVRFADDPVRLRTEAERSARVTHLHPIGVDAAVVQAAAVGATVRDENMLEAAAGAAATRGLHEGAEGIRKLIGLRPSPSDVSLALGNSSAGHESVPAAIFAALAHARFEDAVVFAVRCGGDTDTIAAMTGAIAGARGGRSSIPDRWLDVLEDTERGRTHVEQLARELCQRGET